MQDGMGIGELVARNALWMGGNLFLAWSAVIFVSHLRGSERSRRVASRTLIFLAAALVFGRLVLAPGLASHAVPSRLTFVVFLGVAIVWSWRVCAGDRWARVGGYLGVLAFAPNAPYILTDLFHFVQDVRYVHVGLGATLLLAVQYGWFLTVGAIAWIALVIVGRDWLGRHAPRLSGRWVLVAVSLMMAFGVYLGRIERFHSWHPLGEPRYFAERVARALTSPGPIAFTIAWWGVIAAAACGGLLLWDRAPHERAAIGRLVAGCAWLLSGGLLVGTPLIALGYRVVDVPVTQASHATELGCVVFGMLLGGWGLVIVRAALRVPGAGRHAAQRRLAWIAATVVLLPVFGAALTTASIAQWYAQFRGLCEYSPNPYLHGDSCPD
jgi:uncharacterized membrane protein